MPKVTFTNSVNGCSLTFAADTPQKLLAAFDGDSLGADFVQFKPVGHDGSRTLSHTLNARTVTMTVNWHAEKNGKRSRSLALKTWEEIQWTFVPGDEGTLVWSSGGKTRTINCYAAETPVLRELASGLFSADIKLIADYPLWKGSTKHSAVFTGEFKMEAVEIDNACPVPVPPLIKIEGSSAAGSSAIITQTGYGGRGLQTPNIDFNRSDISTDALYIDCAELSVYRYAPDGSGKKLDRTHCLSPLSEFFYLYPGKNIIVLTMNTDGGSDTTITFYWNDHYLGVSR